MISKRSKALPRLECSTLLTLDVKRVVEATNKHEILGVVLYQGHILSYKVVGSRLIIFSRQPVT